MKRGRLLLSGIVALTSPLLLMQGLAGSRVAPGPASWNGFWQAELSLGYLQIEEEGNQLVMSVREGGSEAAKAAFTKEPLASDAMVVIAAAFRSEGDLASMQALLDAGYALDKRNRQIGAMQLEQAAKAGNLDKTFDVVDRLALTNPRLVPEFVEPLTMALNDEEALPQLQRALARDPVWAGAFWYGIPSSEVGVGNMYKLRQSTDIGTTAETDSVLLSRLAQVGLFEEALDFWDQMSGRDATPTAFVAGTKFAPVGWQSTVSRERDFARASASEFDVYIEERTFGELARQLLRLQPGTYQLSARVSPGNEAANFEAKLECATDNSLGFGPIGLDKSVEWTVGDSCLIYWLVIGGSAWNRRTALRASITDIEFRRAD